MKERISSEISENAKKGEEYATQTVRGAVGIARLITTNVFGETTLMWNRYAERWEAQVMRPGIRHLIRAMR